jgi:prepilin-type N-terminal cleavage/methylation domain-containing protein
MLQASMRKHREGEAGFTLVELLVVIVILGVLAAIVVFAVGGISNKSKSAACNSDVATVQTAEEAYYAQNNVYVPISGTAPTLLSANLIRSAPSTTNGYTISVTVATGAVISTPACSTL